MIYLKFGEEEVQKKIAFMKMLPYLRISKNKLLKTIHNFSFQKEHNINKQLKTH